MAPEPCQAAHGPLRSPADELLLLHPEALHHYIALHPKPPWILSFWQTRVDTLIYTDLTAPHSWTLLCPAGAQSHTQKTSRACPVTEVKTLSCSSECLFPVEDLSMTHFSSHLQLSISSDVTFPQGRWVPPLLQPETCQHFTCEQDGGEWLQERNY